MYTVIRTCSKSAVLLAVLTGLLAGSRIQAAVLVGDFIKFVDGPGSLGGGEFNINDLTHPTSPRDISFCVQTNEFIDFTHTFYVAGIETYASQEPDAGGQDPLDARTAYLFYHFTKGDLSNYQYAGTAAQRGASADSLQNAIWKLEDENFVTPLSAQTQAWITEATNAVAGGSWVGLGTVRVAHMFYAKLNASGSWVPDLTHDAQDQLIVIPVPGLPVPEPTSIFTWSALGLGALGIGFLRRRRATAK